MKQFAVNGVLDYAAMDAATRAAFMAYVEGLARYAKTGRWRDVTPDVRLRALSEASRLVARQTRRAERGGVTVTADTEYHAVQFLTRAIIKTRLERKWR